MKIMYHGGERRKVQKGGDSRSAKKAGRRRDSPGPQREFRMLNIQVTVLLMRWMGLGHQAAGWLSSQS